MNNFPNEKVYDLLENSHLDHKDIEDYIQFSEEKYIQSQLVDWKELFTPLAHSFFDSSNGGKRLQKIYGVSSLESFGPFSRAEVAAGGALVEYLNLTQQGKIPRLLLPQKWNAGEVLEIDSATRNNLELIRTIGGSRKGSLLTTIDKTISISCIIKSKTTETSVPLAG